MFIFTFQKDPVLELWIYSFYKKEIVGMTILVILAILVRILDRRFYSGQELWSETLKKLITLHTIKEMEKL